MSSLDHLLTEQLNPRTADLDALPVEEALARMNDEDQLAVRAVREEIPRIAAAVAIVEQALRSGGRLIYAGAGTSGRLGCLDAAEIPPTFGAEPGLVVGIIAGGERALRHAVEGAEDDPGGGERSLREAGLRPEDVVCGIAASGRTPFVRGALDYARRTGCRTLGIVNTRPSELDAFCDVLIAPLVGPEVVGGSTRLKAGTSQKLVLNMISSLAMVRLGKTYGNLMVDVRATNEKLRRRAVRLVREATGCDEARARSLLEQADGHAKLAILLGRTGLPAAEGRRRLEAANGFLRRALAEAGAGET